MLVMVSMAFRLFVGTVIFALCCYGFECSRTVHSLVADSSLLDCCDVCFVHLMFAGRPPFAF